MMMLPSVFLGRMKTVIQHVRVSCLLLSSEYSWLVSIPLRIKSSKSGSFSIGACEKANSISAVGISSALYIEKPCFLRLRDYAITNRLVTGSVSNRMACGSPVHKSVSFLVHIELQHLEIEFS